MCNHAEQAAEGGTLAVWRFQVNKRLIKNQMHIAIIFVLFSH